MRTLHKLALSALAMLPAGASSHPGHVTDAIHGLLHGEHVVVLVIAALAASVAGYLLRHR